MTRSAIEKLDERLTQRIELSEERLGKRGSYGGCLPAPAPWPDS